MTEDATALTTPPRGLRDEKTFKKAVTLVLAALTFATSLIVIANVRASTRGSEASRDARILEIRFLTYFGKAQWNLAAERDLLSLHSELSLLMFQAQAYIGSAKQPGEALYYRLSQDRLGRVRDVLAKEGALTQPPYSRSQGLGSDQLQYYQDKILVPTSEILERQEQKKAEGGFYGTKSSALTSGLAVLAVGVFLLTLSLVLGGTIRFFMAGSGIAIVAAVLVSSAVTAGQTWHGPGEDAIRTLTHASGLLARGMILFSVNGDPGPALEAAGRAETETDRVLAAEPDYMTAIQIKAAIRMLKGEALFYDGKIDASRPELEQAAAGYDRLIAAGRAPGYNLWFRGNAEYLLGRREASERSYAGALKLMPEQGFRLGAMGAVSMLAGGQIAPARNALDEAIDFARAKPLGSDPFVFRTLIRNLERLQEIRPTPGLPEMIVRLKEARISLAAFGESRPRPEQTKITDLEFVAPIYDKWGDIVDAKPCAEFPRSTARAYFQLGYSGMVRDQSIVRKVYYCAPGLHFWNEMLYLDRAEFWDSPKSEAWLRGDIENILPEAGDVLKSGDYRVEFYINGRQKASAAFKIL
jgi:tetratricopeptide (TPR) repeat protein